MYLFQENLRYDKIAELLGARGEYVHTPPEEAAAIVRHREKNGNFEDWRDLLKVEGIDPQKIESAKDRITL